MGYSDSWLRHTGGLIGHNEVVLHVFDRIIQTSIEPIQSVLVIGVGNNGIMEVWREALGEGAKVRGLDWDHSCGEFQDVLVGDMSNGWIREALRGSWFDLIIDTTHSGLCLAWPFLRFGGRAVLEHFEREMIDELIAAVVEDTNDTWLPIDEVMSVQVYPTAAVIEKRSPRVVPYQHVISGVSDPVVKEAFYVRNGYSRVSNMV